MKSSSSSVGELLDGYLLKLTERYPAEDVEAAVVSTAASLVARRPRRKAMPDRIVKERSCRWCHVKLTTKEMLVHKSRCPERPRDRAPGAGRPVVLRKCRHCGIELPTQDTILHEPHCSEKPVR